MKEPTDDRAPLPQNGASFSAWRPFKYGLIGAMAAVAGAVLLSALRGMFFGQVSAFYGSYPPGWDAAYSGAVLMFFLGGLPIGGTGFAVGLVVGLVKSLR